MTYQDVADTFRVGDVSTAAACFDADRYYSNTYEADLAGTWAQQKANRRAQIWTDAESEQIALIADGDRVAYQALFTGTHSGEYLGIPATDKRVTLSVLEVWRIENDKIVSPGQGALDTERARLYRVNRIPLGP